MIRFSELEPHPRRRCRIGWHHYRPGWDDNEVWWRCTYCLKRYVDHGLKITAWLREHHLPRIHGCIWDRHCRYWAQCNRISLMWGDHGMFYVDFPSWSKSDGWGRPGMSFTRDRIPRARVEFDDEANMVYIDFRPGARIVLTKERGPSILENYSRRALVSVEVLSIAQFLKPEILDQLGELLHEQQMRTIRAAAAQRLRASSM